MTVTDLPVGVGRRPVIYIQYDRYGESIRRSITTRVIDRARFCSFSRLINFQCFVVRSRIPDVMNILGMFFSLLEKCFLKNYWDVFLWNKKKKSQYTLLEERKLFFFFKEFKVISHNFYFISLSLFTHLFISLSRSLKNFKRERNNNTTFSITFSIT